MAKVTWSVPLVQFGRCEVEFEGPDALQLTKDPAEFGAQYARFVAGVMKGYEAGREQIAAESRKQTQPTREQIETEMSDGDHDSEESAIRAIKEGLGATEVDQYPDDGATVADGTPPWEAEAPRKSEPWKAKGPVKNKISDLF